MSANDFVSDLVVNSETLLKCQNCGRIILVKEDRNTYEIRFFQPEN